jgi:hypothetical protein
MFATLMHDTLVARLDAKVIHVSHTVDLLNLNILKQHFTEIEFEHFCIRIFEFCNGHFSDSLSPCVLFVCAFTIS